jgi:hypothetical protein
VVDDVVVLGGEPRSTGALQVCEATDTVPATAEPAIVITAAAVTAAPRSVDRFWIMIVSFHPCDGQLE